MHLHSTSNAPVALSFLNSSSLALLNAYAPVLSSELTIRGAVHDRLLGALLLALVLVVYDYDMHGTASQDGRAGGGSCDALGGVLAAALETMPILRTQLR